MSPAGIAARLVAMLGLVASGLVLLGDGPAAAAGCAGSTGVTVVVDFHQLGGGVRQACDADGGGKAASTVFPDSGFPLAYVQRQPGFVCRVSGAPAGDPCVNTPPATAYWSLWWSDGTSGTWTYASVGVGSLKVPDGGYLAFSWQGQEGKAAPGVAPSPRTAPSSPSPSPGTGESGDGDGPTGGARPGGATDGAGRTPGTGTRSGGAAPSKPDGTAPAAPGAGPGTGPSTADKRRAGDTSETPRTPGSAAPSPGDTAGATDELSLDSPPSGGDPNDRAVAPSGGNLLPAWASVLAVGGLLAAAASVAAVRTRRGRS